MTINIITKPSFKSGFSRGFTSITGVHARNAYNRMISPNSGSVSVAWRDVGLAIQRSMEDAKVDNVKTAPKKR